MAGILSQPEGVKYVNECCHIHYIYFVVLFTISQNPQYTIPYPTMHHFVTEMCTCAHFCYKVVHCGMFDALWDLWDESIVDKPATKITGPRAMSHECYGTFHWPHNCLFKGLSRLATKKSSKVSITGPLCWESTCEQWFPTQNASNMESIHTMMLLD